MGEFEPKLPKEAYVQLCAIDGVEHPSAALLVQFRRALEPQGIFADRTRVSKMLYSL